MKRTAPTVASLVALLLGLSCGSPASSPMAASASPPPTPAPTPTPPAPTYLYTLWRQGGPAAVLAYRIERESGRLTQLGRLELREAHGLAAAPRGDLLHVDRCLQYKHCQVVSLRVGADGLPTLVAESEALSANIMSLRASASFAFARWDDSSTGYSAGIAAFRVDAGTGSLGPALHFARRGGRYSTSRRLYAFGLGVDGSRAYVAESGGRLASYPVDASGPGEKTGESSGHPDRPLHVVPHPQGGFVYVLSEASDAAALTTYALEADGAPVFRASVPVGLREPRSLVLDPAGRWLWVSGRSGIEAFSVDAQSGVPDFVLANGIDRARGFMAVEPQGRFLYLVREDGSGLAAFRIDGLTGALGELGPQVPGDTDPVVLERPLP